VPILKNQRHEGFAQGIAKGLSATEAFRAITPGIPKDADVKAAQMRRQRGVEARIQELKAQNAQRAQMTREELLSFYASVIRTPADRVPPGSCVIQSYEETPEGGRKIRIVDKAAAGQALARMCAWNEPEQLEIGATDSLKNYLMALRSQSFFGRVDSPPEQRAVSLIEIEGPAAPARNGELGETS
jgi:hypothetical protein